VFTGVSSLVFAVAFHAMRGMYLHAERLRAKAGRQGAREGFRPPEGRAKRVILRSKNYGDTLAPRQGSALSEVWLPYSRAERA
jgi:hypothetical protein